MWCTSAYFDRSTSWMTFTESCDSWDLLLVNGWNASGCNLFRRWGGGVVGNVFFDDNFTNGGVGGGVYRRRVSTGDVKGEGGVESFEPGSGEGGESVVSTGGNDDVDGRGWCENFGELCGKAIDLYADQCSSRSLDLALCSTNKICAICQYNSWTINLF